MRFSATPRALLLDAAGTLFRIREPVGTVYAARAFAHGLAPRAGLAALLDARFGRCFGEMRSPAYRVGDRSFNDAVDRAWWRLLVERVFEGLGPFDFESFFKDVYDLFALPQLWELYPEVESCLHAWRGRGFRLAIVSNFDQRLLPVCAGLGLLPAVDTVVFAAEAGAAKPAPAIFLLAVQRLGVTPGEAVHIGDSLAEDAQAAVDAGLGGVLVDRHGGGGVPAGVRVVADLRGVDALLDR